MFVNHIIERLAGQLRREAISRRRVHVRPRPGQNTALYLSEEEIEFVLSRVYGSDWEDKLREEVQPEPGFEKFEEI